MEGTAGNTGIGLALVGRVLGYRTLIVIPQTQSQEKKDAIRLAGATLREVPAVPYKNPDNYVRLSGRLAEELAATEPGGVLWANQFDNVANRQVHLETTGPEIWEQTGGKVDGFVCAVGTGGSLAGIGMALKARRPDVVIACADPLGAGLYHYYTHGELKAEGNSITEGIGQNRITANLEGAPVDRAYAIPDQEALPLLFDLAREEGLVLGAYDARVTGRDGDESENYPQIEPFMRVVGSIAAASMNAYLREELKFEKDLPYEVLAPQPTWNHGKGNSYTSVSGQLADAILQNPHLKVLAMVGWRDLVTPPDNMMLSVRQMRLPEELRGNIEFAEYESGHMMYTNRPDMAKMHADIEAFIASALK